MTLKEIAATIAVGSVLLTAVPIASNSLDISTTVEAAKGGAKLSIPKSTPKVNIQKAPSTSKPAANESKSVSGGGKEYKPSKSAKELPNTAPSKAANTNTNTNNGSTFGNTLRNIGLFAGGMMLGGLIGSLLGDLGGGFLGGWLLGGSLFGGLFSGGFESGRASDGLGAKLGEEHFFGLFLSELFSVDVLGDFEIVAVVEGEVMM